ncbi:hypothetical protein WJX74_007451 [Apatococcus lobatus]|uniref:Uncharacterized protein n=1 Tax=Apatococcus lobatus TaxID=904363 RepID=A0AAW1R4E2_9CHLO
MFYSVQILNKKGPLGVIWIAAHLDRRLKRSQVNDTSIPSSVDSIMNPEAPLALRLSSQLLLGVVRIYSRKVGYLFEDCNQALSKIKQAFKAQELELPRGGQTAPLASITLPDNFDDLQIDFLNESLFESFAEVPEGEPIRLSMGNRRQSIMLMDDNSDVFLSQRSGFEEEEFEVAGEDLEGHIRAMTELRRRRSQTPANLEPELARAAKVAPDATPAALDFGASTPRTPGSNFPDNEEQPADQQEGGPGVMPARSAGDMPIRPPSEPPSAEAARQSMSTPMGDGITPLEGDFLPALPEPDLGMPDAPMLDVEGPSTPPGSVRKPPLAEAMQQAAPEAAAGAAGATARVAEAAAAAAATAAREATPEPARQRRGGLAKRKRPRLDVGPDGRPATQLPSRAVHALLQDRSSLLTSRGQAQPKLQKPLDEEEDAQPLMQPATGSTRGMAPALAQLFESRMKVGITRRVGSKAKQAAAAAAEPSQADAAEAVREAAPDADRASPAQMDGLEAAAVDLDMPMQDALDLQLDAGAPGLEGDLQDGLTPNHAGLEMGSIPAGLQHPDELNPDAADMGQPPGEMADGDVGGDAVMATGGTPGMESPSKTTGRDSSHDQAATPGRFGAEQDLSARLVGDGQDGLGPMPELDAVPEAREEAGSEGAAGSEVDAQTSFTARTKQVLGHLKDAWGMKDTSPGKRKTNIAGKSSNGALANGPPQQLQLAGMLAGKSKLEAARVFFELLVLNNKGYVKLDQEEPYSDIGILPASQIAQSH